MTRKTISIVISMFVILSQSKSKYKLRLLGRMGQAVVVIFYTFLEHEKEGVSNRVRVSKAHRVV